jgi:hypothetical protein
MCSYETIFNYFGKLIDSYEVRNPMDLVAGFPYAKPPLYTKKYYSKSQLLMETYDRNVGLQNKFRFF